LSDLVTGAVVVAGGALLLIRTRQFQREVRRQEASARGEPGPVRRIVVVGVGFAGLTALNRLNDLVGDDPSCELLVIDRQNYHLFYPLLYQVATGGVEPGELAFPARIVARERNARFLEMNVLRVDVAQKRLETDLGPISYDCLILAPGSVTNYFGMADAMQSAFPLKSLADGMRLRNRVIDCFEQADRETSAERRRGLLTFAIVGGGATGVELAASLGDMIFNTLLPNYPTIGPEEVRLVLIEAKGGLLAGWDPRMGEIALRRLTGQHVEVWLNTSVAQVGADAVETVAGSNLPTATVVWTAGVRAEPLAETLPGTRERDGRVRVTEHLELPDQPGVFVVGDAAAIADPNTGRFVPPTAAAAIDEGAAAAENAVRRLRGEALQPFVYHSRGDLVSLGRAAAAANLFGLVFDGVPAWLIRRGVYLANLVGFRNRLYVMLDWAFVSFHQRVIAAFGPTAPARPVREAVQAPPRPRTRARKAA
jgi:NADH dehydrogenase